MVMPRSRSRSMASSICSCMSRAATAPVRCRRRSESVVFPWSMCAMMLKLRICGAFMNAGSLAVAARRRSVRGQRLLGRLGSGPEQPVPVVGVPSLPQPDGVGMLLVEPLAAPEGPPGPPRLPGGPIQHDPPLAVGDRAQDHAPLPLGTGHLHQGLQLGRPREVALGVEVELLDAAGEGMVVDHVLGEGTLHDQLARALT